MTLSRRALLCALGAGAAVPAVASCTRGGRGGGKNDVEAPPEAKGVEDPEEPLVIASLGASYGTAARWEQQIAVGFSEAMVDVNAGSGGVFGKEVQVLDRYVSEDPGEDLSGVIGRFAEQGVRAVVSSLSETALIDAIPVFVETGIAVVDIGTTGTEVRAPEVGSAGLVTRLQPPDRVMAARFVEAAFSGGSGQNAGTQGLIAYVGEDTSQGHSLGEQIQELITTDRSVGRFVGAHYFDRRDFGSTKKAVSMITKQKPAVVVVHGDGAVIAPFLKALHEATTDGDDRSTLDVALRLTPPATIDYSELGLPEKALARAEGYQPGGELTPLHVNMMLNIDRNMLSTGYNLSQQAYDAAMLICLAAVDAQSLTGTEISAGIKRVLGGATGCGSYADCLTQITTARSNKGKRADISYEGRMGALELGAGDDPVKGALRTYGWADDNSIGPPQDSTFDGSEQADDGG